jgi:hypothetical protein
VLEGKVEGDVDDGRPRCRLTRTEAGRWWLKLGVRAEKKVACGRRCRCRRGGQEWMQAGVGGVRRTGRSGEYFLTGGEDSGGGGIVLAWWRRLGHRGSIVVVG